MTVALVTAPTRVGVGPGLGGVWGWLVAILVVAALAVVAVWTARGRRR